MRQLAKNGKKGMGWAIGLALGVWAWGCAGPKEAGRDIGAAIPGVAETQTGVVTEVREDFIAVRLPGEAPEAPPVWFQRTADTRLVEDGQPANWTQLVEGTAVRVRFEAEPGPERAYEIEVLSGDEAEQIRRQVEE